MNPLQDAKPVAPPTTHVATREGDEGRVVGISIDSTNPFDVDIMANKWSRGAEQVNPEVVERVKKKGKRILQETEKPESSKRRS